MEKTVAAKARTHIKLKPADILFNTFNLAFMISLCAIILLPLLNVVSVSFSSDYYIYTGSVTFFPRGFYIGAYERVLQSSAIWRAFGNSVFVALTSCVVSLLMTSLAAYPLVFAQFYGKKVYNLMILLTMWFHAGLIPTYMVVNKLGLINNLLALVIVPLIGAYNVIIMRSFYQSIPGTLIESAKIDGAQDFTVLFKIVMPLSKAVLATVGLWIIVGRWNDFMAPVIYLKDYHKYTLQVLLRDVVLAANAQQYGINPEGDTVNLLPEQLRNATIVVTMTPVLVIYPFLQKYFVKGVMLGAVKE
jgi:putative aldouronate transport system permease protein